MFIMAIDAYLEAVDPLPPTLHIVPNSTSAVLVMHITFLFLSVHLYLPWLMLAKALCAGLFHDFCTCTQCLCYSIKVPTALQNMLCVYFNVHACTQCNF